MRLPASQIFGQGWCGILRTALTCVVLALLVVPSYAAASNVGVARQRMTASLLQRRDFEQGGYGRGYQRQLLMREGPDSTGSVRWAPVELVVRCRGRSCTGRVWIEEEPRAWVLEDRATFRGRKGTYHETGWAEP